MNTYAAIHALYKERYNRTIKPCWIADVKEMHGIALKSFATRPANFKRKHPCPERVRANLEAVMRELGILPAVRT